MVIKELEKSKWEGHEVYFSDYADASFGIHVTEDNGFKVDISKEKLDERKRVRYPMRLFKNGYKDVQAFGVFDDDKLVGGIEFGIEEWSGNPRLFICLLWVDDSHKRKGIAVNLMNLAKERAKNENLRAIFVTTYSRNEHAVAFYLSQGFKLIGFDSCWKSNEDAEEYEALLKFGIFIS